MRRGERVKIYEVRFDSRLNQFSWKSMRIQGFILLNSPQPLKFFKKFNLFFWNFWTFPKIFPLFTTKQTTNPLIINNFSLTPENSFGKSLQKSHSVKGLSYFSLSCIFIFLLRGRWRFSSSNGKIFSLNFKLNFHLKKVDCFENLSFEIRHFIGKAHLKVSKKSFEKYRST